MTTARRAQALESQAKATAALYRDLAKRLTECADILQNAELWSTFPTVSSDHFVRAIGAEALLIHLTEIARAKKGPY